jgi:hypothetical protein
MSRAHIRVVKKLPPPRIEMRFWLTVGVGVFAVVAVIGWVHSYQMNSFTRHLTADGTVSETRIVVAGLLDSSHGGGILYRTEAHVRFMAEGQQQDRWLTASELTADRGMLAARIASHPGTCIVYWTPGHADAARCSME